MKRLVPCLVVLLAVVAAGCGGDSEADDEGDMKALAKRVDASAVAVTGDSATVKANGNKASLTSQGGAWLIASEP